MEAAFSISLNKPTPLSGEKAVGPDFGSGSWACQGFGSIINGMLESLCYTYRNAVIPLCTTSFSAVHWHRSAA